MVGTGVKCPHMNMIVILYIIYTQENSQIFNMFVVGPNTNMTLAQAYYLSCQSVQ